MLFMCIVVLCFNHVCEWDMEIAILLRMIKDLSSEWGSQISLFVVLILLLYYS